MVDQIEFESALLRQDIEHIVDSAPIAHFKTKAIDKLLGGVRAHMVIASAEPGAGKTTLLLQMADELASQGHVVLFFSFEIRRPLLVAKSLSRISRGRLPICNIVSPDTSTVAIMNEVIRDYEAVIANNIAFIDKPVSPVDIAVLVGRVERELGVKPIVFLDYIQITPQSSERSFVDERSAVKETVAGLRRIVNGHNVPLFAISSINRSNYKKDSAGLDALAESSSLEYAADSVLFLSVKGKGDERLLNMKQQERPVTITMLKNRYGVTGSANLVFDTSFALFREV